MILSDVSLSAFSLFFDAVRSQEMAPGQFDREYSEG
jgi:hypothetical protein